MPEPSPSISIERLNSSTGPKISGHSLEELERRLSDADLQETEKKVLLQGVDASLCLRIIDIAWRHGWAVAILREDFRRDPHPDFFKNLGSWLFVSSPNRPLCPVGLKLQKKSSPAPAYDWREDECAAVLFTSGSTGDPKGVCHSQGNMLRSARLFIKHFNLTPEDHLYCLTPVHTASGFRCLMIARLSETRVTMHQSSGDSFPALIQAIAEAKPTKVICGPVFVHHLAAYGHRLVQYMDSVEALLCTGAILLQQDRDAVEAEFNIKVLNYYGQTETAGIELADQPDSRSSTNLPSPCDGVRVELHPDDNVQGAFQLHIATETIYLGYFGKPLFRRTTLNTGDLVSRTPGGGLNFIGRGSNVFKAPSTEWLFPEALETWLKKQPLIKDGLRRNFLRPR